MSTHPVLCARLADDHRGQLHRYHHRRHRAAAAASRAALARQVARPRTPDRPPRSWAWRYG